MCSWTAVGRTVCLVICRSSSEKFFASYTHPSRTTWFQSGSHWLDSVPRPWMIPPPILKQQQNEVSCAPDLCTAKGTPMEDASCLKTKEKNPFTGIAWLFYQNSCNSFLVFAFFSSVFLFCFVLFASSSSSSGHGPC